MYRRKWFLLGILLTTGALLFLLYHTDDKRGNSSLISGDGPTVLSAKSATRDSGMDSDHIPQIYKEKYETKISSYGKSLSVNDSLLTPGRIKVHRVSHRFPDTNLLSANNSLRHTAPRSDNVKLKLHKKKSRKNVTYHKNTLRNHIVSSFDEERVDNTISVQAMDKKIEWMKIREEKRANEEDKLMLQKQRKILEQQQMELEQEKIKLAEEVRRFSEYRRRLDELHKTSLLNNQKQSILPAREIDDLWQGLDPHKVETKYPGIQLDGDYMLRPFVDPDDPRAMGMFGNPRSIDEMNDAQAEERFYQLLSVEHVHCSDIRRMGNVGDGGWDLCIVEPFKPHLGCLIYSFGINNDFTFDDAMSETFNCDVKSFDPSMNVDDHMHSDNVLFYNLGLGSRNNITEKEWNIMTLSSILAKLGHSENIIDYLKFDVEFSEWESLPNILADQSLTNVKQLAFEIHTAEVMHVNRQSNKDDYIKWYTTLLGLEQQGFRRFHYHFNPYGRFTSLRTGRDRSCCYELYYINLKFLNDTN